MKTPYAARFVPLLLLFALACSDNPVGDTHAVQTTSTSVISPTGSLDQNIVAILALLPKGLETAATTRWSNVKSKYAAGLSDPSQMAVAKQMLFDLSSWVKMKAPDMDTPPNAESKTTAAARAVLYMSLYIFNGPPTTPPPYNPGADAVVGLVTPGAAATVVTPTLHAGVQFEAGSVSENTIIVVTQNLTPYGPNCSGPLQTGLCQYPQFYTFDQFPHKALLKAAKFAVCHINGGTFRSPLRAGIHDRFRLAHTKPANPADYTPGSTVPTQPGENIEILPLTTQTFTICDDVEYTPEPPPIGVIGALTKMGRAFARLVTPKTAYAIDQGGGGVSRFFSPFNDVDPLGLPDRSVQSLTVTPLCGDCAVHPGDHVTVSYTVKNIGTATAIGVPATIHLVPPPPIEGPPGAEISLLPASIPLLVPNDSVITINLDAPIPADAPIGDYTVKMTVGTDVLPEEPGNLDNNSRSVPLTLSGQVIGTGPRPTEDFANAYYGNGLAPTTEGEATLSALFSDEFAHAETFASRLEIDRRSISVNNPTIAAAFRDIQRARADLDQAVQQTHAVNPGTSGESNLLSFSGIMDVLAAENWCSGMPASSVNASGVFAEGAQMTTAQLLQLAVSKFDAAITIAGPLADRVGLLVLANSGKARALLNLNDIAGAVAAAGAVPIGNSFVVTSGPFRNNGVFAFQNIGHRWTVSDNEGVNGLPYRSDNDPRVPFQSAGVGFDQVTPLFVQLKYPSLLEATTVAGGYEMRLIEAEGSLRSGDLAAFTASINAVRIQFGVGLRPLPIPASVDEARALLFKERAYDLWLTSHRLGDLRRLVRQYDMSPGAVFPSGEYPKGGSYGTDVNFPIPVDAQFNPHGLTCFDRNA